MASGMPELGSKISLISKADIRYEGRLFTVDPQECTIALASVRSFGTEDRESQYPVAPQNQVYEYILFRGSDIKDIRVVNNVPPLPNDPAIMQLSVPPSMGNVGGGNYQQNPFGHQVVNPNQYPQYHPMGGLASNMRPVNMNQQSSELSSQPPADQPGTQMLPNQQQQGQAKDRGSMLDMITSGSRSETPLSNLPRKSPTMEQSTQAGSHQMQQGMQKQQKNNQGVNKNVQSRPNQNQRESRNEKPMNNIDQGNKMNTRPRSQNRNNNTQQNHHQQQQQHQQHQQQSQQQQHHQQQQQQHHQMQQNNRQQQGWGNNRGRGGGRITRGRGGGFTGRPQQQGTGDARTKNTLKFDNDYDFEQANTEFEELRSQLAKTKISDNEIAAKPETEPKEKVEPKPEAIVKELEPEDEDSVAGYDKTKSFFDNISCEAVERSKGRSQRTDWKTERKLNSETFGVASARRGGYRGRGYWNGGSGGGGGGMQQGWRGNSWRGGRGNRGSSQHRQRQNNQVQPSNQKMVTVTGWD